MLSIPANVVAGVVEVVRVAPEGGVVAKILAVLLGGNGLVHGVDRLQDLTHDAVVHAEALGLGLKEGRSVVTWRSTQKLAVPLTRLQLISR